MTTGTKPKSGLFNARARTGALLGALLGASALPGCGPMEDEAVETARSALTIILGTPGESATYYAGEIINSFQQSLTVPQLPHAPSAASVFTEFVEIANDHPGCDYIASYFNLKRQGAPFRGSAIPGWTAELNVRASCTDYELINLPVNPGDQLTWSLAPQTGGVYEAKLMKNGSVYEFEQIYLGTPEFNIIVPAYVRMNVDSRSQYNCANDLPAHNVLPASVHTARIDIAASYNSASGNHPLFVQQPFPPPAGLTPAGCNLSVTTQTPVFPAKPFSRVQHYGF